MEDLNSGRTQANARSEPAGYERLSPDCILDAVDATGLATDGRLMALNSFENRVYQIGLEDGRFVVAKFYRPGRWSDAAIGEEHSFTLRLAEAEIPVTPPLELRGRTLHRHGGYRFAVFPRQGGREPVLESEDNLAWLGRSIGRMHAVGRSLRFDHRLRLLDAGRVARAAAAPRELGFVPPHLEARYAAVCEALLPTVRARFGQAPAEWLHPIHGDCHRGNVLWTEEGPHFVDFDDVVTGPAVADFWMLLDGEPEARRRQLDVLLEGYEQFCLFDDRQLRLLEALRAARMIEYAAWIANRWGDPTFPTSFPWFDQPRYWEDHLARLEEQAQRLGDDVSRGL